MADLRDDAELAWRDAPGTPPRWARSAVMLACMATVAIPAIGCSILWKQTIGHVPLGHVAFKYGLASIAVVAIAVIAIPKSRVARPLHVAVLLPIVHVGVIAIAWALWRLCAPSLADYDGSFTIARTTPLAGAALGLAAIGLTCAIAVARGRRDVHWSHAFALFGLVFLLALGLWLPIASGIACGTTRWAFDPDGVFAQRRQLVELVLAPPLAVAIAYTWLAIRSPNWALRYRGAIGAVVLAVLAIAIAFRFHAKVADALVYGNFIPLVLAAALVACGGLAALVAIATVRERALRRRLATTGSPGTILAEGDEPTIGALEIAGWLRAPRTVVRPFVLATPMGAVPIPGARLVAAVAPATTALHVGEAVPIVRVGDAVVVAGLELGNSAGPFRSLAGPVAGDDVVVARTDSPPASFADIALGTWRPAVAYLGILVMLALPALAALVPLGK